MEEQDIECPYCGEHIGLLVDCSIDRQQYTEDCQVCCSPILVTVEIDADGTISNISGRQENG